jgi:dolichyl-phosphate-mannose--protein O-mannosyl transferase
VQHLNTGKNLHSHLHQSPISHNQEVSCYGSSSVGDTGDNWELQCVQAGDKHWRREAQVAAPRSGREGREGRGRRKRALTRPLLARSD